MNIENDYYCDKFIIGRLEGKSPTSGTGRESRKWKIRRITKTIETIAKRDAENLRALARARSCTLLYECLQQPPSHRHRTQTGGRACYSKRQDNTRGPSCKVQRHLAEESALNTTSKTMDARTDHLLLRLRHQCCLS
jgi:hypothetical protein